MTWVDRLKSVREFQRVNQQEMATLLGVPYRTYQSYETGASEPKSKVLERLVAMGINGNWLLTGVGEMFLADMAPAAPGEDDDLSEKDAELIISCYIAVTELLEESNVSVDLPKKITLAHNMFRREKALRAARKEDRPAMPRTGVVENHS